MHNPTSIPSNRSRFAPFLARVLTPLAAVGLLIGVGCSSKSGPDAVATSAPVAAAPPPYTAADRELDAASFEYIWETIRDKHYDPTLGGINWQAVHDELKPRVDAATSRDQARGVMTELVHRLGKSHFNIVPAIAYADEDEGLEGVVTNDTAKPAGTSHDTGSGDASAADSKPAKPKRNTSGEGSTGLDLRIVDGQAMITDVLPDSAGARAGVKPGWLIASIDGSDIPARIQRMNDAFPESTSKPYYLAEAVLGSLGGSSGDTVAIEFVDGADQRLSKELTLAPVEGTRTKFGNLPALYVNTRSVRLPENVQYFKLNIFFDPPKVIGALTQSVKEAQANNVDGFIIDLRGNPGGIGAMAMGVAGWFVQTADSKLGTMTTRNGTVNFVVHPRFKGFTGPVAVLVDGMSGSTSEIFAAGMQDLKRARVFGTRTAGAALPSTFEILPNRDRFQYAIANYESVGGLVVEGNGVTPDQEVKLDRGSLLAGRDPVVDAAVAWIKSKPAAGMPESAGAGIGSATGETAR